MLMYMTHEFPTSDSRFVMKLASVELLPAYLANRRFIATLNRLLTILAIPHFQNESHKF